MNSLSLTVEVEERTSEMSGRDNLTLNDHLVSSEITLKAMLVSVDKTIGKGYAIETSVIVSDRWAM